MSLNFIYEEIDNKKIWGRDYFPDLMELFDKALSRKRKIVFIMEIDDESPNSSGEDAG